MKKFLKGFLVFLIALCMATSGFAAIDIQAAGTSQCTGEHVNFSTGTTVSCTGNTATVTASGSPTFTGDVTFRSTLLANGRAGGASTLGSSSTQLTPSSLPYSVILKKVGGGGGLDSNGVGTTLQDGTPGQELSLIITGLQSGGSWVVTPTTKTGYSKITLDTVGDSVRLLFVDTTTGWVITSASGVIIAGTGTL